MKNKKIIKIVVILISTINIIFVVSGYLITLYVNSTNYYGTTHNITVLVVLVLVLQIMNIIIISKNFNDNYKKKLLFSREDKIEYIIPLFPTLQQETKGSFVSASTRKGRPNERRSRTRWLQKRFLESAAFQQCHSVYF